MTDMWPYGDDKVFEDPWKWDDWNPEDEEEQHEDA